MRKATSMKTAFFLAFAFATSIDVGARASGAALRPSDLSPAAKVQLESAIGDARLRDPRSFEEVAALRQKLPLLDQSKRGDVAQVAVPLEDIGDRALFPIVHELVFSTQGPADLTSEAWRDWRVALVEALGLLHDARTEPVVLALLAKRDAEPWMIRASVEAAGRLATRATVNRIVALKPADLAQKRAVWEGMGECRRLACVQALGSVLATSPDAESSAIVARSIGRAASSWAWQTPSLVATGEGAQVRALAARSLMNAIPNAARGFARGAMFKALTVVDDPSTAQLARDLRRKADPELARSLDDLLQRIAP